MRSLIQLIRRATNQSMGDTGGAGSTAGSFGGFSTNGRGGGRLDFGRPGMDCVAFQLSEKPQSSSRNVPSSSRTSNITLLPGGRLTNFKRLASKTRCRATLWSFRHLVVGDGVSDGILSFLTGGKHIRGSPDK